MNLLSKKMLQIARTKQNVGVISKSAARLGLLSRQITYANKLELSSSGLCLEVFYLKIVDWNFVLVEISLTIKISDVWRLKSSRSYRWSPEIWIESNKNPVNIEGKSINCPWSLKTDIDIQT